MSEWKRQLKRSDGRYALVRTAGKKPATVGMFSSPEDYGTAFISSSDDRSDLEYYIQVRTEMGLKDSVSFKVIDTKDENLDEILGQIN